MKKYFILCLCCFFLISCSTIPKGAVLVNEIKLNALISEYLELQEEVQNLRDWKNKMFF